MYDPLIIILISVVIIQNGLLLTRKRILNRGERSILVDTSVLIDGRILDIAEARFIPGRLLIPRSVLGELQLLADGSDHEKRLRARNGLELITKLQAVPRLSVDIYHDAAQASEGVDNRLLSLARKNGFEICTVDYNLQKVADAQGIKTLSINELSRNLKALYLPGERVEIPLTQKGQEKNQAIGYASDGTMVVVDGGDSRIGQTAEVEIIRSLQTNSGKMMFAKMVTKNDSAPARTTTRTGGRMVSRLIKDQSQNRRRREEGGSSQAKPERGNGVFRRQKAAVTNEPATSQTSQGTESQQTPASQPAASSNQPRQSSPRGRRGRQSPEDDLLNLVNKQ